MAASTELVTLRIVGPVGAAAVIGVVDRGAEEDPPHAARVTTVTKAVAKTGNAWPHVGAAPSGSSGRVAGEGRRLTEDSTP
jgi:hypothetical protein